MPESRNNCRYLIREKFFTIGNSFKIKDELGHNKYIIRSKMWTFGRKLILEDMNGNALLKIHQKAFRFLDQFNILSARDGELNQQVASIRQKFTFFKNSYKIYSKYGEYKFKGLDVYDQAFVLKNKDDKTIAIVNKKYLAIPHTYDVEVINSINDQIREDHAFILALIIALHCLYYC
ncbi:unnamed protein product [Rotaria sordida]|uniref:Uncharacterized protein n=1 Tax=Rotaria sordida TaxID=392033 RepID=A0A814J2Q0_9BILA|nr:unnamed protein product [Rotaria sordida]CAF0957309.1 unnamed protein product [Rotaria sordida]CAF1032391.1 unnamed protein product [Rotaria sordida]CAF1153255.1 unnamed protein product [Rotaria sordida]CAF3587530.1 unnamed protein product [Rotaria sordida]